MEITEIINMATMGITAIFVLITIFKRIAKAFGWEKGVHIATELESVLNSARHAISDVTNKDREEVTTQSVSNAIAGQLEGVTGKDIEGIVNCVAHGVDSRINGVDIKVANDGKISVEAAGFVSDKMGKLSKWLKKI